MSRLLIVRPRPGADATARLATDMGFTAIVAPLFTVVPLAWDAPDPALFDAVLMTSANAARQGGTQLERYRHLPLFAVGSATADAARAGGFTDIRTGTADGAALLRQAANEGAIHLLHLAGREHIAPEAHGLSLERRLVYASEAATSLPAAAIEALRQGALALLHSPRAAELFGRLAHEAGLFRPKIALAAFSEAVQKAAGSDWKHVVVAEYPDDKALLAAAARLCDQETAGIAADRDKDRG